MNNLILEIGTEEIPPSYIKPALNALSAALLKRLSDENIAHQSAKTYGTPCRLTVVIEGIAEKQDVVTEEVSGPPKRVAFDESGKPTIAAEKFAKKIGITVSELKVKKTPKGEYICGMLTKGGDLSKNILKSALPEIILSTPFPKTMRWGAGEISFARPIHSVMALLGEDVISFTLGNEIKSSRYTKGHKIMSPKKIKLSSEKDYISSLKDAFVIADITERKSILTRSINEIAASLGGKILKDDALIDTVTQLVEYPVATSGNIDAEFLALPQKILITAMREHQKYFAVVDETGRLMPYFIAINNTKAEDLDVVSKGHERVLRARLSDAKFFYDADLKVTNTQRVEKLKRVLFQAKLGSVYDKTLRVQSFSALLSEMLMPEAVASVKQAALFCKSDLVSQVVGEFSNLQGMMGRIYAEKAGEDKRVALAIEEHYRPIYSGGALPETGEGALLAIADKLDTIFGCFHAGLLPSGASDPYALRRQGIGVLQIILMNGYPLSFKFLIEKGLAAFIEKSDSAYASLYQSVFDFLEHRLLNILLDEGYSRDVIQAVLGADYPFIPDVLIRVKALEELKKQPDFEPLAITFKRVVNIIKKSAAHMMESNDIAVNSELFEDACESSLYSAFQDITQRVEKNLKGGDVREALIVTTDLRPHVDRFFDGVMVMTDDKDIKENRFSLLCVISKLFGKFADFSKITTG